MSQRGSLLNEARTIILNSLMAAYGTNKGEIMELIPGGTLITATPEEGRVLAMLMARKSIGAIQPDAEVRKTLRAEYSTNADSLTGAAHVVAIEFATVAAANKYWRK